MTIAGSDSGAGAGVQADLKTFAAHGVFGTSVITALTAQNTAEVLGVQAIDPAFVDLQITAVLDDLPVASVKTGMLANASIVAAVARRAAAGELPPSSRRGCLDLLLPHTDVLTPNTREASLLTGSAVGNLDEMIAAGRALCDRGARTVIVKGGHLPGDIAPDVVVGPDETLVLEGTRVVSANDHGTGCTLSAAVAALLARGSPLSDAVRQAKSFVRTALEGASSWHLGRGHGPLDHFGWGAGE